MSNRPYACPPDDDYLYFDIVQRCIYTRTHVKQLPYTLTITTRKISSLHDGILQYLVDDEQLTTHINRLHRSGSLEKYFRNKICGEWIANSVDYKIFVLTTLDNHFTNEFGRAPSPQVRKRIYRAIRDLPFFTREIKDRKAESIRLHLFTTIPAELEPVFAERMLQHKIEQLESKVVFAQETTLSQDWEYAEEIVSSSPNLAFATEIVHDSCIVETGCDELCIEVFDTEEARTEHLQHAAEVDLQYGLDMAITSSGDGNLTRILARPDSESSFNLFSLLVRECRIYGEWCLLHANRVFRLYKYRRRRDLPIQDGTLY